jgi:hypothetical protein
MGCDVMIEKSCYNLVHEHGIHRGDVKTLNVDLLWLLLRHQKDCIYKLLLNPLFVITKEQVADLLGVEGFIKKGNYTAPFFQIEYETLEGTWGYKHQYITNLSADQFHFLLKGGFDIFQLIEELLALDKTKFA